MPSQTNPLLDFSDLNRFGEILPEHVTPAIEQLLAQARATIAEVEKLSNPTWANFVEPQDTVLDQLGRAWGAVNHLNATVNTPELREAYNTNLPKITQFHTELGQNLALFERYKQLAASPEFASMSPARKKVIENELRDFRLSGAELPDAQKQRFAEIQEELSSLSAKFEQNLLDATDSYGRFIEDVAELAGLPADKLTAARDAAERDGKPGYKLTLHMPSYLAVQQYAENRALREEIYRAYSTRAAEFGPEALNNTPVIERILQLKAEMAPLVGFETFADYSLATKMAESPAQVVQFLRDLASRAKPFALQDRAALEAFAKTELGLDKLEPWDVAFVSDKLQQARYSFSEQEVRQYFTEPKVLAGLFGVIESLYSLKVSPDTAPVWHSDVGFYKLTDRSGKLVGQFYLDLYARQGKRGGAWMDDCRNRRRIGDKVQTPVVYLTCNFSGPVDGKPALFTHSEITTLFHEFGHGLHQLLTEVDELSVAGINGVEWDAVELPSQFMENFCWEWDVVSHMSQHVETGETLPRALFDRMLAAKNYLCGMFTVRQIEFSMFDMLLHSRQTPATYTDLMGLLDEVRREVAVIQPPAYNRFPNSFGHIFAGGYSAGYFSYKWAEVLSADAYGLFEEEASKQSAANTLDPAVGERFRKEVLAVGGSRPALDSFRAFRGREPSIDALLRHNGMI